MTSLFLDPPIETPDDDPIPKVFSYFLQQANKTARYTLTPKRHRMAEKRWREEEKYQLSKGVKREELRAKVSISFRHVINELVASKYHQENGYVEWEQLFRSAEKFEQWLDRYENGYSEHQVERSRRGARA